VPALVAQPLPSHELARLAGLIDELLAELGDKRVAG
jgi:hypothetical protein